MSTQRGKPVHLTNGERRLLLALIDQERQRLEALAPPVPPTEGPAREAERLRKLRLRQFRRLALELAVARPDPINPQEMV